MTTPEDLKNIAPGSLVFFSGPLVFFLWIQGENAAVVLKQKPSRFHTASAYDVLWSNGVVQEIFFWPDEAEYVTIIPPNPSVEE